ncbi:hypothetical protein AGMMS50249_6610 [candidate division SR1 bacterium]|nr:hypothetical protein AGMMS50249_6610 [candidate division SR1 bacterium]
MKIFGLLLAFGLITIGLPIFTSATNIEIGDYDDFVSAVSSANSGDTISLTGDISSANSSTYITVDKTLTIDLNGHNIAKAKKIFKVTQGVFTITGSGTVAESTPDYYAVLAYGSALPADSDYTTVIIGADVILTAWAPVAVVSATNPYGINIEINGTLNAQKDASNANGPGVYINGSVNSVLNPIKITIGNTANIKATGVGIYAAGYTQRTINGATIEGVGSALGIKSGKFTINGGNFKATSNSQDTPTCLSNGINNYGGTIEIYSQAGYQGEIELTINGGTFTSLYNSIIAERLCPDTIDTKVTKISISGATFIAGDGKPNLLLEGNPTLLLSNSILSEVSQPSFSQNTVSELPNDLPDSTKIYMDSSAIATTTGDITELAMESFSSSEGNGVSFNVHINFTSGQVYILFPSNLTFPYWREDSSSERKSITPCPVIANGGPVECYTDNYIQTNHFSDYIDANSPIGDDNNQDNNPSNQTPTQNGGGGGGISLTIDSCPNGDFSDSYYDKTCEASESHSNSTTTSSDLSDDTNNSAYSDEEIQAYQRAFSLGITSAQSIQDARLGDKLTRAQLAKMAIKYAINILHKIPDTSKDCSAFLPSLSEYVGQDLYDDTITACQLDIMGIGENSTVLTDFIPDGTVIRAEFATTFSRMLYGNINDNNSANYATDHILALKNAGILTDTYADMIELRGWIILMMYRASLQI